MTLQFGDDEVLSNGRELQARQPFFLGLDRAMISLGPLTEKRFCPYRCSFCYVRGPFPKYSTVSTKEVINWLRTKRKDYSSIYISGDTDSFAKPRSSEGLELLRAVAELKCTTIFTTRYCFDDSELEEIQEISAKFAENGNLLVGCMSISQLNHPTLEPHPIADPVSRVDNLRFWKKLGITTALTIRPFIRGVPALEYKAIAELGVASADIVLGGNLYVDTLGNVQNGINAKDEILSTVALARSRSSALDFSLDDSEWKIVEHPEAENAVRQVCEAHNVPFFMRSGPAMKHLEQTYSTNAVS